MRRVKLIDRFEEPLSDGRRDGKSIFLRRKITVISIALLAGVSTYFLAFSDRGAAQNANSCITCHSTLETRLSEPVQAFEPDVHRSKGLSCSDCHGGNPAKSDKAGAKDPVYGYVAKPTAQQIPAFCGKCHSDAALMKKFNPSLRVDQVQEYSTSVHGSRLKAGDQRVATCVSCHGVHGIRAPSDPQSTIYPTNVADTCSKCHSNGDLMAAYGIPHDQFDKYKASVHAKALLEKRDLSAPTCNDCHGNHGAVPPGLTSVANVCGQCHGRQSELFQKSPHKAPFEKMQAGECLRCHGNHQILPPTDAMAGAGAGSVCTSCHSNDAGFAAAGRMGGGLLDLQTSIERAKEHLENAERAGMEVSRPLFELRDAVDGLTQARVLVHTSSADQVEEALKPAAEVAAKSYAAGDSAFGELSFRRKGLVVSLFFILFLASLVYLKVRQIEKKYPSADAA